MIGERVYFIGVVEDRQDPLKSGRVRVRCFYWHSPDKTLVPTDSLPWASVQNKLRLKEGDHVKGYFEDGRDIQIPVVTELCIGIPEQANKPDQGFNDPRTDEQLQNAPRPPKELKTPDDGTGVKIVELAAAVAGQRLNEPCLPRLVRGENLTDYNSMLTSFDEIKNYPLGIESMLTGVVNSVLIMAQQQVTGLIASLLRKIPGVAPFVPTIIRDFFTQTGFKKYTLSTHYTLPPSPAKPVYPYNDAQVSESGHICEIDDTPGAERINQRHRTGTGYEMYPDGDLVTRVRKDKHLVVDGSDTTIIRGKKQLVVEGSDSVTIRGARYIQVEGDCQIVVLGNASLSVKGDLKEYIKGDYERVVGGNYKETIVGTYTQVLDGESIQTYNDKCSVRYGDDFKQHFMKEWHAKFMTAAFIWNFASGVNPVSDQEIQPGATTLPNVDAETGNADALSGKEFSTEITVQTKALDNLEEAAKSGDLTNFDAANAGYTIIKTTDETGMFVG